MKVVDRIIFIIVGLFLTAIAAGCVLLAVDVIAVSDITAFLSGIKTDALTVIVLFAFAIILFAVALKLLFVRPKKNKVPAYTIDKGDDGEISVSITAIENTIKLAMVNFDDIKDVKINITVNDSGIDIFAKVAVPTGIVIPTLLNEVKDFTKTFTEQHTGVTVNKIKLVATEYKNIDTVNERKKISAAKRQDEKKLNEKTADAYASTHAKILLTKPVEDNAVFDEEVSADGIDPDVKTKAVDADLTVENVNSATEPDMTDKE